MTERKGKPIDASLGNYFAEIVGERSRHDELKIFLDARLSDFRQLAHQAGIEIKFSLNVTRESKPGDTHVSIEIQKGKWPHRRFANVQIRERSETEPSGHDFIMLFDEYHREPVNLFGSLPFGSAFAHEEFEREGLVSAVEEFICGKILSRNEFERLLKAGLPPDPAVPSGPAPAA